DIRAAHDRRHARQAALHGARAQPQPDLVYEARHSTIDPSIGGNSLRVGILLPILDLGRARADARSAQAALTEQDAALAEATRVARLSVETTFRTYQRARRTVESFRSGRLDRSRELLDMAR